MEDRLYKRETLFTNRDLLNLCVPIIVEQFLEYLVGLADSIMVIDLRLTEEVVFYLEEMYIPHMLVGVMAQNKPETSNEKKGWSVGEQTI